MMQTARHGPGAEDTRRGRRRVPPRKRSHGEGSVYQRASDGRWIYSFVDPTTGKRRYRTARTKGEAQAIKRQVLRAVEDGLPAAPHRQKLGTFLIEWLGGKRPPASGLAPKTFSPYEQIIRIHLVPALGNLRLAELTPPHLERLYAHKLVGDDSTLPLAPQTVVHIHRVLHRTLEDAVRWGFVIRNVSYLVSPPRVPAREMQVWTPEQARAFLRAAKGHRLEALFVLALHTGLRQAELLGLKWQDSERGTGSLQVVRQLQRVKGQGLVFQDLKTAKSRRRIELSEPAQLALRRHRLRQLQEKLVAGADWKDTDLVFCNTLGKPLEPGNLLRRVFFPLVQQGGLPRIRFHDLRHYSDGRIIPARRVVRAWNAAGP